MTKKKTTKPKAARARSAPAAEEPTPTPNNAVPEPAPAIVDPVGLRTNPAWSHRDRNPRPVGELTRTATLVRGTSFTISYSTGPVVFRNGKATPINESEFARLSAQVDRVDFPDPSSGVRIERHIRKFRFETDTGEPIDLPPLPDREVGPLALSLGDQAQRDRLFEGQEHTRR